MLCSREVTEFIGMEIQKLELVDNRLPCGVINLITTVAVSILTAF